MVRAVRWALGLGLLGALAALIRGARHRRAVAPALAPSNMLDDWLPDAPFRDTIALWIRAEPSEIFRAVREVTLRDMPLAWAAGELRYAPARLAGSQPEVAPDQPFVDQLIDGGNLVLGVRPEREILLGVIGKLHQLTDQQFVRLRAAHAFHDFHEPGFEKLGMSFRIVARDPERGALVALEHRTQPIDDDAYRKFARYWLAIRPGGAFVSMRLLQAVRRRAERQAPLPIEAPA